MYYRIKKFNPFKSFFILFKTDVHSVSATACKSMFILYLEAHKGHQNKAFSLFLSLCLFLSHGTNSTKSNYSIQQDLSTGRLTLNSKIGFSYFTRAIHLLKILSSLRIDEEKGGEERLALVVFQRIIIIQR